MTPLVASILLSAVAAAPAAAQDPGLRHAPPPLEVDGLVGQPIDVVELRGTLLFDVPEREARATARLTFRTTAAGMPLFDLRQDVESATLDGEPLDPKDLALHDVSDAAGAMRILEVELEADSEHVLELEYGVRRPMAPGGIPVGWGDGTVTWDTWFSDLSPGRYLELWFPANLLYDSFRFTLELEVRGAGAEHRMITNGEIEELGEHHWRLRFPPTYTAFSPMVVVVPVADVEEGARQVTLPDGKKVLIQVHRRHEAAQDTEIGTILDQAERDLIDFTQSIGPWPHGDRCPIYVWRGSRSMEYDGATTTALGALRHELYHSWFGRGVKPASQNDGWWDEAWNMVDSPLGGPPRREAPEQQTDPVTLCSDDPYNRVTPRASYSLGALFFVRLADVVGWEELRDLMDGFFRKYAPGVASTGELEQHVVDGVRGAKRKQAVRQLFHRYVYGRSGEVSAAGNDDAR